MKHSSREEYYQIKKTNYSDMGRKNCPFCDFKSEAQKELIVWEGSFWYLIQNKFPYTNQPGQHLMAVPYNHKCFATELGDQEFIELKKIQDFVRQYFGEKDYFSFSRETFGNRSLEHYHVHFLNGKLQGKFLREMLKGQGLFE